MAPTVWEQTMHAADAPRTFLIIQTAFIGDVVLATGLIESIRRGAPQSSIDFLLRKGNESLLKGHPHIRTVHSWDKQHQKYLHLFQLARTLRRERYDVVINLQRFAASGFLSWRSRARTRIGFAKNPFAFCYTFKVPHQMDSRQHETERNFDLLAPLNGFEWMPPKLYPSARQNQSAEDWVNGRSAIVMAPSSVWFTKQLPRQKWIALIRQFADDQPIFLIGGAADRRYLEGIRAEVQPKNVENLAGKIDLLTAAALIAKAEMTYVNDSAPLHLASAMNAPVTAFFCSTVPEFGFGPLSTVRDIRQTTAPLHCRPCGIHGKKSCPQGHFNCGTGIALPQPKKK